jgi:phosphoglycolate phosphatase
MAFTNLQAVLFDLDGTLVHTHIDFARMKQSVLRRVADAGLCPDNYRAFDSLAILTAAGAELDDASELLAGGEADLVEIELEACERATEAEGAADTLAWLRESGLRVGIVTRNSREAVERVLRKIPLPHDTLLTRADTPRVKPDPLHLFLALERLEAAPEHALMVGDHVMDVLGGKAAGTHTLGLLTPERPDDFFARAEPDGVIRSLRELRSWISP